MDIVHSLFIIHSSVDGNVVVFTFRFLQIMLLWTFMQFLWKHIFLILVGKVTREWDCWVILNYVLHIEELTNFFKAATPFHTSAAIYGSSFLKRSCVLKSVLLLLWFWEHFWISDFASKKWRVTVRVKLQNVCSHLVLCLEHNKDLIFNYLKMIMKFYFKLPCRKSER